MAKVAKIMFSDFIDHFAALDDKQIVKDVRKSIEDLAEGNSHGKSFGAFIVKSTNDRIAKARKKKSEAGRMGGLASVAARKRLLELANQNNDQAPIDVSTPTISANDPTLTVPSAGGSCADFRGSAKTQGDSNTGNVQPDTCPESGKPLATTPVTTTQISTDNVEPDNVKLDTGQLSQDADIRKDSEDRKLGTSCTFDTEARQNQRTGAAPERVKNQPSSHCGKAPVRSFGESGLVHMTDAQANSLRSYYGEDFDRAVGILENYILSLPSKAEGDEKGEAKFWREDYAKRNHYFAMRRDNWVDNALKKAKTADKRLENASNPNYKSFKQQDIDARTEFFSKSIFDKEVV